LLKPLGSQAFGIMMALLPESTGSLYGALPSFEAATEKFNVQLGDQREKILSECRAVVERHGLEDMVGIDLKHTHFGMPEGHVLAEVQVPEKLEARMCPQAFDATLVPFAFALISGMWQPYEFVTAGCEEAALGLAEVQQKPGFLQDLAVILTEFAVQDILGFHVRHRSFLEEAGVGGTVETPGATPDELLLRPNSPELHAGLRKQGAVEQVMWLWGGKGPMKHSCAICWCSHCGSHCNSHK